jgi:hypothetical protein
VNAGRVGTCECGMTGFHRRWCPARTGSDSTNPKHYEHASGIETMKVCRAMTFTAGSAFKYILRYEDKADPVDDLKKCRWYAADVKEHGDPVWISEAHYAAAVPLLFTMLEFETNAYRQGFYRAAISCDVDAMITSIDAARAAL